MPCDAASKFVDSYTQSFYGLWVDGIATNNKWRYLSEKAFYVRNKIPKVYNSINFDKVLWLSGTFSSDNGTFKNSVWLTGTFNKGTFQYSSFNPYVIRSNNDEYPLKLNTTNSDYSFTPNFNSTNATNNSIPDKSNWVTGDFIDSDFYMSRWLNGNFISGTAWGMIFYNGVSNFMNAYNVIWEGGTWKNGNWYGSNFDYVGYVNNEFTYNILKRGLRDNGNSVATQPYDYVNGTYSLVPPPDGQSYGRNEVHIWNLFKNSSKVINQISDGGSSDISFDITVENTSSYNFGTYYDPNEGTSYTFRPPRPETNITPWVITDESSGDGSFNPETWNENWSTDFSVFGVNNNNNTAIPNANWEFTSFSEPSSDPFSNWTNISYD